MPNHWIQTKKSFACFSVNTFTHIKLNVNYFYLNKEEIINITGICMEALCTSRDTSQQSTLTCLLALNTLFDTAANRVQLLKDRYV